MFLKKLFLGGKYTYTEEGIRILIRKSLQFEATHLFIEPCSGNTKNSGSLGFITI